MAFDELGEIQKAIDAIEMLMLHSRYLSPLVLADPDRIEDSSDEVLEMNHQLNKFLDANNLPDTARAAAFATVFLRLLSMREAAERRAQKLIASGVIRNEAHG